MYKHKLLDKVTKIVKLGGLVSVSCSQHFLMKHHKTEIVTKHHMIVNNITIKSKVGAP
jgi:hypothetical protein